MDYSQRLIEKAHTWLRRDVFPLWIENGIDVANGSFEESLSRDGKPQGAARRAMVQARQIYSFVEGARLGVLPENEMQKIVGRAVEAFLANYALESGAFVHAVDGNGKHVNQQLDLYAQAFALFGLAEAYGTLGDRHIKERALKLLAYLRRERALPGGGYSELTGDKVGYEANPHMHLFEAAVAWMKVDQDAVWAEFANELDVLCRTKFIDRTSGALCEHFAEGWTFLREENGAFIWEPGHHCEWAWLLTNYMQLAKRPVDEVPFALFRMSERFGLDVGGSVVDEVFSAGRVKKSSARFWPQGERVKAAVALGAAAEPALRPEFAAAADQALGRLFRYFEDITPGLWADTRGADGAMEKNQSVKASSLYHIINAIAEYTRLRPQLRR